MLLPLSYITNTIDFLTNLRASDVDSFWRQNINMLTFTRYQYITCRPLKSTLVPIFWPTRSALNMHGAFCSLRKAATSSIISLAGNWALSPPIENQNICQRKLKFAKCIEFQPISNCLLKEAVKRSQEWITTKKQQHGDKPKVFNNCVSSVAAARSTIPPSPDFLPFPNNAVSAPSHNCTFSPSLLSRT